VGSIEKLAQRARASRAAPISSRCASNAAVASKSYLRAWLCRKPDRCQDKRPENGKGSAISVGEAEYVNFRLVTGARGGPLRGYVQCDRDERPERSAAEGSGDAGPGEYSTRPSQVQVFGVLICAGRVEQFEKPTC